MSRRPAPPRCPTDQPGRTGRSARPSTSTAAGTAPPRHRPTPRRTRRTRGLHVRRRVAASRAGHTARAVTGGWPGSRARRPPRTGSTSRELAATTAHDAAKASTVPRQPIASASQPPTIRPARIPAEIPAVTIPSTVARSSAAASRPATELSPAPTVEHAPITPITGPSSTTRSTAALSARAAAKIPNWVANARRGQNRSTRDAPLRRC